MAQKVKNLPAMQETWDGSGGFPGVGNGSPLQYLTWEISWTEEPSDDVARVEHN